MASSSSARFFGNLLAGFAFLLLGVACAAGYGVLRVFTGALIAIPAVLAAVFFLAFGIRSIIRAFRIADAEDSAISIQEAVKRGATGARFGLYLRPFALDYSVHATHSPSVAFDEMQRRCARGKAPANFETVLTGGVNQLLGEEMEWICLGRPGEFEGAGRLVTTNEQWRAEVEALADAASIIVLVISGRAGTQWEIAQTISRDWLRKTIFVIPSDQETFSIPGGYVSEIDYAHGVAPLGGAGYSTPRFLKSWRAILL